MNTFFLKQIGRTIFFYCAVGIASFVIFPFAFFYVLLPEKIRFTNHFYFFVADAFYRFSAWATLIPITTIYESLLPNEPAIFVANHQSALDIAFAGKIVQRRPHVWLLLDAVARRPLIGFIFKRLGIVVDASTPRTAANSLLQTLKFLRTYSADLVLFPEGGRFTDGSIHPFFSGFALLSEKTNRPVVPILLKNMYKVYPPGSFYIRKYPVTITVGTPFKKQENETDEAFTHRVHNWFVEHNN